MIREGLQAINPCAGFFIGIDSDGCVFDSMTVKHRDCFAPVFIEFYGFDEAAEYAEEVWEFVNLYSVHRGLNRFLSLTTALDLLGDREEIKELNIKIPDTSVLREWCGTSSGLSNESLRKAAVFSPELERALEWSMEADARVKKAVAGIPPFPGVRESIAAASASADLAVISNTPSDFLVRDWESLGLMEYVRFAAGHEYGSKESQLTASADGKYEPEKKLMIGDSPGDLTAAKNSRFLFYPIVPGLEEQSWKMFLAEGLERFLTGRFAGDYEDKLIEDFIGSIPDDPPWIR